MNWKLIALVFVLLDFAALTVYSMVHVGYLGRLGSIPAAKLPPENRPGKERGERFGYSK